MNSVTSLPGDIIISDVIQNKKAENKLPDNHDFKIHFFHVELNLSNSLSKTDDSCGSCWKDLPVHQV